MRILVTGTSGFIGSSLANYLAGHTEHAIIGAHRGCLHRYIPNSVHQNIPTVELGDLGVLPDLTDVLKTVDVIIHTAAQVQCRENTFDKALDEYRCTNVEATIALAKQAIAAGIKRFVFLSSIKVNGEKTLPDHPFSVRSTPEPKDPYGISKFEAEKKLRQL